MKKLLIAILFLTSTCQALTVRTVTVKPSGGDYTSSALAIVGEVAYSSNQITGSALNGWQDQQLNIEVYKNTPDETLTATLTNGGFITDTTHFINIYTANSSRHSGVFNKSKHYYRSTNNAVLLLNQNCIRFEGFQIEHGTTPYRSGFLSTRFNSSREPNSEQRTCDRRMIGNIIWCSSIIANDYGMGNNYVALFNQTAVQTTGYYVYANNIVYNYGKGINDVNVTSPNTYYIYNNTFYFADRSTGSLFGAIYIDAQYNTQMATLYYKNNLVVGATQAYYWSGTNSVKASSQCNLSSDLTSPNTQWRGLSPKFVNASPSLLDSINMNLYLVATDTSAYQQGVDLSVDPDGGYSFNTDAGGNVRPTGKWSIGALELQPMTRRRNNSIWIE